MIPLIDKHIASKKKEQKKNTKFEGVRKPIADASAETSFGNKAPIKQEQERAIHRSEYFSFRYPLDTSARTNTRKDKLDATAIICNTIDMVHLPSTLQADYEYCKSYFNHVVNACKGVD